MAERAQLIDRSMQVIATGSAKGGSAVRRCRQLGHKRLPAKVQRSIGDCPSVQIVALYRVDFKKKKLYAIWTADRGDRLAPNRTTIAVKMKSTLGPAQRSTMAYTTSFFLAFPRLGVLC